MCLTELGRFEPVEKGWQVKCKWPGGDTYYGLFHGNDGFQLGGTYEAEQTEIEVRPIKWWNLPGPRRPKYYQSGFHVFHKLSDAEKYMKSRGGRDADAVIVQVECLGTKQTGYQEFEYLVHEPDGIYAKWTKAPVTVCSRVKLLMEISYEESSSNKDAVV